MLRLRERSPVWSVKSILLLSVISVGATVGLVFGLGQKPLLTEALQTVAILSALLFGLMFTGLFWGVRLKHAPLTSAKQPAPPPKRSEGSMAENAVHSADMALDAGVEIAAADDGCLVGLGVGILVFLGMLLIAFLFESGILLAILVGIYWLLSRALRQVFIKSRICRGRFLHSLTYAVLFTTLYTGWAFAFIYAVQRMSGGA